MPERAQTPSSVEWAYSFQSLPAQLSAAFLPLLVSVAVAAGLALARAGALRIAAVALGVALVVAVFLRARRMGVWATSSRVVVKNFIRTYEFDWADVSELRVAGLGQYRAWVFEKREGGRVSAQCLPLRGVYGETQRLAAASASAIRINAGESQPDDG